MALILSNEDLHKLNPPMAGAVDVIERCCRIQASGDVVNHPRVHLAYPPGGTQGLRAGFGSKTLRVLPAIVPDFDAAGFRTYAMGPRRRNETHALLILFSFEDMTLLAIINDTWLHYLRTGAPAGVAAKYLARKDINTVGVLGTGKIARRALEAVACVRSIGNVEVFSPTAGHRRQFADDMSKLLGTPVDCCDDVASVVAGADILLTATNAYKPVFDGNQLKPGTLVISTAPGEIDIATIERSTLFSTWKDQSFHDQPPREPFKTLAEQGRLEEIEQRSFELHEAVTGNVSRRDQDEIITCLVPAASLWDPAVARWAYDLAKSRGIGREVNFL